MRVGALTSEAIHRIRYTNAGRGGRTVSSVLPVLVGEAEGLPSDLDALVITSDLQGVVPSWIHDGANVLLGVHLVDQLLELSERGALPYPERTGVILAGDLYSAPAGNVRGASGDVREVWTAFAAAYRWVAGVQGNHDRFGSKRDRERLEATEGVHLLDGEVEALDGLSIGGVGEIMGNAKKPGRKSVSEFLTLLELVVDEAPDLLVLHQGPDGAKRQSGDLDVRERTDGFEGLVVCGHVHWEDPLHEPAEGPQVLNVDSRVVVLQRPD